MVTINEMGIKGKVETIVRVGKMVISPRKNIIMGSKMKMLERERKRIVRCSFLVKFVPMTTLHIYAPNSQRLRGL
jgi:hypothetical protein